MAKPPPRALCSLAATAHARVRAALASPISVCRCVEHRQPPHATCSPAPSTSVKCRVCAVTATDVRTATDVQGFPWRIAKIFRTLSAASRRRCRCWRQLCAEWHVARAADTVGKHHDDVNTASVSPANRLKDRPTRTKRTHFTFFTTPHVR